MAGGLLITVRGSLLESAALCAVSCRLAVSTVAVVFSSAEHFPDSDVSTLMAFVVVDLYHSKGVQTDVPGPFPIGCRCCCGIVSSGYTTWAFEILSPRDFLLRT